jgi:hypothetical protein
MPNCDFYGVRDDHRELLDWLFAEGTCEVHELASRPGEALRRFVSADDVLSEFDRTRPNGRPLDTVHLQLYVLGAGPPFATRRIEFNPAKVLGPLFRHDAEGWGLVQLYLAIPANGKLAASHTNHNTRARALQWSSSYSQLGPVDAWDFERITRFSSRLNRRIKSQARAKSGSRVVLAHAFAAAETVRISPEGPALVAI